MNLECNIINQKVVTYNKAMSFGKCLCYELELTEEQLRNFGFTDDIDKIEFYIKPIHKKDKIVKQFEWSNKDE